MGCLLSMQIVYAQSSVLSSGSWYKIGITETGIYKIDANTLAALGITGSFDPRKIKVYGNGVKGILPQSNAEIRPIDLLENAIFVSGESDGSFDDNDYVLFYGTGPNKESWTDSGFEYEKNIYSDTAYYFLRIDGADGKRIETKTSAVGTPSVTVTEFDDYITFEDDRLNLISSGRGWYGAIMASGTSQSFSHQIDGLNSEVTLNLVAVSQSSEPSTFDVSTGSTSIGSIPIGAVRQGIYDIKAIQGEGVFTLPNSSTFTLDIGFDGNDSGERGFIDYYFLTFRRNLQLYTNETDFRWNGNVGGLIRYKVSNGVGNTIWNVSDPINVSSQLFSAESSTAVFQSQSSQVEEYVVFSGSDFPTPFIFGNVPNQNIRAEVNFDGVIVTHPSFKMEAERLAQFHRDHDGLSVNVVTTTEVYNEFSSGRQDISAIRDYARHVYQTGATLKYLLLFGDCSYDYKERIPNNSNFVPTYESRESFDPILSHSSDDYFGFMEESEGEWPESSAGDHTIEIGVGRLPVKTIEEATTVVDKIIHYSASPNTLGSWRSDMTYVADDGDGNEHVRQVERLSELIDTTYALYNINKVLLDAFVQEASGSSEKSPQASSALKTRIKNGTFIVNFLGHGNERLWMEEEILTKEDISQLTNGNKLPIFVTATCEFGRFDDPVRVSGAEDLLLSEQGGGIALLTTSRPVFASTNFTLNQAFHENIYREENGQNLRLGDVIRLTKNEGLAGQVNRNFALLGDPMMSPAYPKLDIVINEIGNEPDTLSALEEVTFTGQIQSGGIRQTDFNGKLVVGIFDIKQSFKTNGQESSPYAYLLRSNALFRGEATVEKGEFSFSFIVPKNISYQFKKGKMSLYAWDVANNIDAGGSSQDFVIGGSNPTPTEDNTPPRISVYLNDPSFVNGDQVGDSPILVANIEDESGITTTQSGIVQGITLTLGDQVFNLNDFYTADVNDFKKGTVVYPMQELEPGSYSGTIKVWDTHNIASTSTVEFTVTDEPIFFVYNPIVFPNPVAGSTTFSFEHDREDEDLFVTLIVYSPGGEVVSNRQVLFENSGRTVEIPWAAETDSGEVLIRGVYFTRMVIRSRLDGATKEITQKIVIVN